MRKNTLKAKMEAGEPAVGVSLTFPSPHMVEILGHCGFDWVLLDCEHGPMTAETVEVMVMASELAVSRNEYVEWVNSETLVCVQVEDTEGLRNLDSILAVDGVDVVFLGPTDLSILMGHIQEPNHPEVRSAIDGAFSTIVAAGKIAGGVGSPDVLAEHAAKGVRYLYTHVPTLSAVRRRQRWRRCVARLAGNAVRSWI